MLSGAKHYKFSLKKFWSNLNLDVFQNVLLANLILRWPFLFRLRPVDFPKRKWVTVYELGSWVFVSNLETPDLWCSFFKIKSSRCFCKNCLVALILNHLSLIFIWINNEAILFEHSAVPKSIWVRVFVHSLKVDSFK